ncbi:phosphotransferase family protein [Zymoseptoria brevis]|uniref:Phosphotransferase family protein n=1 Tax=Zymoseptoria brevis TaxID=1047168 RepID=A0A0F4G706_9PEZI|nr:phosphotransferase family protein [Zymoseptoria brevis]
MSRVDETIPDNDESDIDPFQAFHDSIKQDLARAAAQSPAAQRSAFRQDPRGVLIQGEASVRRIVRVERGVCKAGTGVRVEESRALQFAHALQLPVPTVHEVKTADRETEILMDFVDGDCLEEAWPAMNAAQKQSVAEQIGRIVAAMREVACDQPIGALGGPALDCRQYSDYPGGPFANEAEFNDYVLDLLSGTPPRVRRTLAEALPVDSRIVFSHCDLVPRNIIVEGDQVRALLDWEYAGWYPEYWEYVKFFDRPTRCKDWKQYADIIFGTHYPKQLLTFQALARWQRP